MKVYFKNGKLIIDGEAEKLFIPNDMEGPLSENIEIHNFHFSFEEGRCNKLIADKLWRRYRRIKFH